MKDLGEPVVWAQGPLPNSCAEVPWLHAPWVDFVGSTADSTSGWLWTQCIMVCDQLESELGRTLK